jgi:hypothetical protein
VQRRKDDDMAATKKNPTSRNDTPNTPGVNESDIARLKVDVLRSRLKNHGVKGTADLKKPDLVKKLVKILVSGKAGTKSASSAKASAAAAKSPASAKKSVTSAKTSKKNPTSGNDTPNTPDVNESEIARLKVDVLRRRLRDRGVKGTAELKKPELVKKLVKAYTSESSTAKKTAPAKKTAAAKKSAPNARKASAVTKKTAAAPKKTVK